MQTIFTLEMQRMVIESFIMKYNRLPNVIQWTTVSNCHCAGEFTWKAILFVKDWGNIRYREFSSTKKKYIHTHEDSYVGLF